MVPQLESSIKTFPVIQLSPIWPPANQPIQVPSHQELNNQELHLRWRSTGGADGTSRRIEEVVRFRTWCMLLPNVFFKHYVPGNPYAGLMLEKLSALACFSRLAAALCISWQWFETIPSRSGISKNSLTPFCGYGPWLCLFPWSVSTS